MKTITISPDEDGVRIDRILRKSLPKTPLSSIYRFIRKGIIRLNGRRFKQNHRVKTGDTIVIKVREDDLLPDKKHETEKVASLVHTDFFCDNFNVIYEDEALLVCNKPAGIVVHSGTGHVNHETLIDCAMSYIRQKAKKGACGEPVLVHRLDRDTSGVIVIAKNKQALRKLHHYLWRHDFEKRYIALCHGYPPDKKGTIDLSLVRTHERNRGMKVRVGNGGQHSLSRYRVLKTQKKVSQINIELYTGRTHQIRVHMAHIGCPVIGDVRYGNKELDALLFQNPVLFRRLYLHAGQISFRHPVLDRKVTFTAPLPDAFTKLLNAC